jgi:hypothetical protein
MEVGVVLAISTVGVQHDDVAAFERLTTELAIEIIHTPDATAHEGTQHRFGVVIGSHDYRL